MQAAIFRSAVAFSGCGVGYAVLANTQRQDGTHVNAMEMKGSPGIVTPRSTATALPSYPAYTHYGKQKLRNKKCIEN